MSESSADEFNNDEFDEKGTQLKKKKNSAYLGTTDIKRNFKVQFPNSKTINVLYGICR